MMTPPFRRSVSVMGKDITFDDVDIAGDAKKWGTITALRGSLSHGTYQPPEEGGVDDIDAISIVVPPLDHYFGNAKYHRRGTLDKSTDPYDMVYHEFLKFISLLTSQNPNVMNVLWLPEEQYFQITTVGEIIRENREHFLSKKLYNSYVGYAHGQLENIKKDAFEGYMGERRKKLVREYGFDTKKGAHAIRLLRMGQTALLEERIEVVRPDAGELIAIKNGEWSLEEVKNEADRLFEACKNAREKSDLPEKVDYNRVHGITVQALVREFEGVFQKILEF